MRPIIALVGLVLLAMPTLRCAAEEPVTTAPASPLDFTLTDIDGKPFPLASLKGKVVMLVNVASKCGLTPQYAGLEALYAKNKDKGFVIVGVPANEFGAQEPGTEAEIKQFCSTKYQVTFPMMSKQVVKGAGISPLYSWLTTKSSKPGEIGWNFAKFLVGRDGQLVERFEPTVKPDDAKLVAAVDQALVAPAK
jgi:glutathione peroxidase